MLTLDGSTLEGGGQLVRVALSLSAICNIPVTIHSVRANRARKGRGGRTSKGQTRGQDRSQRSDTKSSPASKPSKQAARSEPAGGLKASHLAALKWLAEQCHADVEGAELSSTEFTFTPRARTHSKRSTTTTEQTDDTNSSTIGLNSPGSIWLIFQALYPFIVFGKHQFSQSSSPLTLHLHGGSHVPQSMTTHYVTQVFQPMCQRIGLHPFTVTTHSSGWAGSAPAIGHVEITIPLHQSTADPISTESKPNTACSPFTLSPFSLVERGTIEKVTMTILANSEPLRSHILETLSVLVPKHLAIPDISIELTDSISSEDPRRLYILLVAHTSNGYVLGRDLLGSGKNPRNERDAERNADQLCESVVRDLAREIRHGGCVDEFMADQIVVFQALARGRSEVQAAAKSDDALVKGLSGLKVSTGAEAEVDDLELESDYSGDDTGSLHARTVRWVAESMLRPRHLAAAVGHCENQTVKFHAGGVCEGIGWNAQT